MEPIRLLIADDHVFYREGVKAMLHASQHRIVVAGEAATCDEAVRQAEVLRPDVTLMDLKMPGAGGVDSTRRIVAARPDAAVLVLTMFDDDSVFAAMRAGARGYLLKDATVDDLARAVIAVHRGEAIFSPGVASRLHRYFKRDQVNPFPDLTDREHDILEQLVLGRSNIEIAERLHLTPKTVRNYVSGVLLKLGVRDRAQAIVKARDAGFPPG